MICKQCGTFFPADGESVGKIVDCPSCHTPNTISDAPVECVCPECRQKFTLNAWAEGATVSCPACAKMVKAAGETKPEEKAVPKVPRFRMPNGAAPVPPAPSAPAPSAIPAPAPASTPAPAPSAAPAPAFKPSPSSCPKPASAPVPAPSAPKPSFSGAPSFKPSPVSSPSVPAMSAPVPQQEKPGPALSPSVPELAGSEIRSEDTSPAVASPESLQNLLPEAAEYVRILNTKEKPEPVKKESKFHQYIREHAKELVRTGIVSSVILLFCLILISFFCMIGSISFQLSEDDIDRVKALAESEETEELSSFLKTFPEDKRFKLEDILLKEAISEKDQEDLTRILKIVSPSGHLCLLQALEPDGQFILEAIKKSHCGFDFTFPDGSTLLEHALNSDDSKMFKKLLRAGASPDKAFKDGLSPLFHTLDNKELFLQLLKKGANVHVMDWNNRILLFAALEQGKYDLLPEIVKRQTSFVSTNKEGRTYLHLLLADKNIPGASDQLEHILKCPCAINEKDPDGKTALELAVKRGNSDLFRQLLYAGAEPYENLENEIKNTSLRGTYFRFKDHRKNRDQIEQQDDDVVFESPCRTIPAFPMPNPVLLIAAFLYIASGFLALRMAKDSQSETWNAWRSVLLLPGGFFALFILVAVHFYVKCGEETTKLADLLTGKIHQDQVHLFDSTGQELEKIEDVEVIPVFLQLRKLFDRSLRQHASEIIFSPNNQKYQVAVKENQIELFRLEMESLQGGTAIKLLKGLAGLNAYEIGKPQNGSFTVKLAETCKQIQVSTIGISASEERAVLNFVETGTAIKNFEQLKFAVPDQQILQNFMDGTGLILVAGSAGNGKKTFVSLLLEKIAEKAGSAAWIGLGTEPPGSERVPRLKADFSSGVTMEQLLAALPDSPAIAITLGSEHSILPKLFSLAGSKKIILIMEKPMNEAIKFCRAAAPADFESNLKLAVRPWLLQKLCSCAKTEPVPPALIPVFQMLGDDVITPIHTASGCPVCMAKGYTESMVLYETCGKNGIPQRPEPTIALLTALQLAKAGVIGRTDLETILKGE